MLVPNLPLQSEVDNYIQVVKGARPYDGTHICYDIVILEIWKIENLREQS